VLIGFTTVESLVEKRPYIFLGCFVVGMLVTPPDVFSQTILAVPMWLLFEVGVLAARTIKKPKEDEEDQSESEAE
jgi:sec-independent protein translocase protein TatC